MAQFQDFVSSPTLTRRGPIHIGRLHAFYLGTILVIGAVAAIGLTMNISAEPRSVVTQASTDVTDGWMPAITYANQERTAERARATADGWSAALLKPEPPVVDGWASALLKPEPPVVDGWASRYLVSDE